MKNNLQYLIAQVTDNPLICGAIAFCIFCGSLCFPHQSIHQADSAQMAAQLQPVNCDGTWLDRNHKKWNKQCHN